MSTYQGDSGNMASAARLKTHIAPSKSPLTTSILEGHKRVPGDASSS
jgi:hypothetical protein